MLYFEYMQEYIPGSLVFVHGTGIFDRIIQWGQSRRFNKPASYYNHVAMIVTIEGDIIEAIGKGVKQRNISKYKNKDTLIVPVRLSPDDLIEVLNFAHSRLSDGYDWWNVLSAGLCMLFGLKFAFGFSGEDICSGLVCRSLERSDAIFPRDPRNMTPADVFVYYSQKT